MTLRLSSLFEIHLKRILSEWTTNKKYTKRKVRDGNVSHKKNHNSMSLKKKPCNGFSDSSEEDSFFESPRNARASRKSNRSNHMHMSSPSSHGKRNNTDSESCSSLDSSNSDEISSKNPGTHENNGFDSEDSYKPKYIRRIRRKNRNNDSKTCDGQSYKKSQENSKRNKTYTEIERSDNDENGKQIKNRLRTKKSPAHEEDDDDDDDDEDDDDYEKISTSSKSVPMASDHIRNRNLRSGSHQVDTQESCRGSNSRPTRQNSRKSYHERKRSDDDNSQKVCFTYKFI